MTKKKEVVSNFQMYREPDQKFRPQEQLVLDFFISDLSVILLPILCIVSTIPSTNVSLASPPKAKI